LRQHLLDRGQTTYACEQRAKAPRNRFG